MNKGIAGSVATTGKSVNLKNAYDDPRFNNSIDLLTNYKTTSMLCIPIFGPTGDIIGVANMINKKEPNDAVEVFGIADQKLFEDFGVFCGLALHKALLMEKIAEQQARLAIALDVMSYHTDIQPQDLAAFKEKEKRYFVPLEDLRHWKFDAHMFHSVLYF